MTEPPLSQPDSTANQQLDAGEEAAENLRAAYEGWLERRGIDPTHTPHLTMRRREFSMFSNAPDNYQDYVRRLYGIPQDDQDNCRYILVDVKPDDPALPSGPNLVVVDDVEFGTRIEPHVLAWDFQTPGPDPDSPPTPESGGAYKTVDIADTLAASYQGLSVFAEKLMEGQTIHPFDDSYGDIGVRAGGLAPDQKDAYVWTASPFSKSVELTIAFPGRYDSVCIIRGQRREAANGKAGMAQIVDPEEVLWIEGEALENLQNIYQGLYREPDFALTGQQRSERDALFNNYIVGYISQAVEKNRARESARHYNEFFSSQEDQARHRARPIPRS